VVGVTGIEPVHVCIPGEGADNSNSRAV
jgi:hypothetical protein